LKIDNDHFRRSLLSSRLITCSARWGYCPIETRRACIDIFWHAGYYIPYVLNSPVLCHSRWSLNRFSRSLDYNYFGSNWPGTNMSVWDNEYIGCRVRMPGAALLELLPIEEDYRNFFGPSIARIWEREIPRVAAILDDHILSTYPWSQEQKV